MSAEQYRSTSQQRVLEALGVMGAHPLEGMSPDRLGRELGCSRDAAYRTLRNLELAGWAMQPVAGVPKWQLTARVTRMAEGVRRDLEAQRRLYLGRAE